MRMRTSRAAFCLITDERRVGSRSRAPVDGNDDGRAARAGGGKPEDRLARGLRQGAGFPREVGADGERRLGEVPVHGKNVRLRGQDVRIDGAAAGEQRHDMDLAQGDEFAHEPDAVAALGRAGARPVEPRAAEGLLVAGVGQVVRHRALRQAAEILRLGPAALSRRIGKVAVEIGEEQERLPLAVFLAHEEERNAGSKQKQGGHDVEQRRLDEQREPLAEGAVADLVVVVQEVDVDLRGKRILRRRADPVLRAVRMDEAARGRLPQQAVGILHEGGVVALRLARRDDMEGMVEFVVPAGGIVVHDAAVAVEQALAARLVLHDEMDVAAGSGATHRLGQFDEDMPLAGIVDLVDGVEPQAVETIVLNPVKGVPDEVIPHGPFLEGDGRAPGRVTLGVEEGRRDARQDVPDRAEVVVDDVEQDHDAMGMGGVDEGLQVVRRAIGRVRRIEEHAVIAPSAPAGELRDGHQLDRGDADMAKMRQAADCRLEGPFLREGADMQFIKDRLFPRPALPARLPPGIGGGIDEEGAAFEVFYLCPRCGIGYLRAVRKAEGVAVAGAGKVRHGLVPAAACLRHRDGIAADQHVHGLLGRRPETKTRPSVLKQARSPRSGHGLSLHEMSSNEPGGGANVPGTIGPCSRCCRGFSGTVRNAACRRGQTT